MPITLYDRTGNAVAYLEDDGESVYLYDGTPVGWLSQDSVFAYSGKHLGWLIKGWIYDHTGNCVYFTDNASGGPAKPARGARPAHGARGARPARGAGEARPSRPARSTSWSSLSGKGFFYQ